MKLSRLVLDSVDWSSEEVLRGSGADLKNALGAFLGASTSEQASELWWGLEGVAFAQNTIYGAAEPTVDVMMAALADGPPAFLVAWILEVLRFILTGGSQDDPGLGARCQERARRGAWLLAFESRRAEGLEERRAVLEVLGLVDQLLAQVVRGILENQ